MPRESSMKKATPGVVAVVCGGSSAEAEISRSSAREVVAALKQSFPRVELFELDENVGRALVDLAPDVVFPALHGPLGEDGTFQGFLEILGVPYVGSGVLASATAMDKIATKRVFRSFNLPVARDVVVSRRRGVAAAMKCIFSSLGECVVVKPSRQGSNIGVSTVLQPSDLEPALLLAFELDEQVLVEE